MDLLAKGARAQQIAASPKKGTALKVASKKPAKPKKPPLIVSEVSGIAPLEERIRERAELAAHALANLTGSELCGLNMLRKIKFHPIGWHPLDELPRSLNLIEQINQMWTCLVSLKAVRFLFARHPDVGGFQLNLGTRGGTDILSVNPDAVAAEGFAAVTPRNNKKLAKDLKKLEHSKAKARYVFFAAPGVKHERQNAREMYGIEVWGIDVGIDV